MAQTFPAFQIALTADASGTATGSFNGLRGGRRTIVTQVGVKMAAAAGATGEIQINGAFVCAVLPTGDAAGGDPPVPMDPGDTLTIVITGAPAGATGTATVFAQFEDQS